MVIGYNPRREKVMADTIQFSNLYNFVADKGVVIPDTSAVKEDVETAFKAKYNLTEIPPETILGRLVEGITMLIVNVVGVNALNANSLNISSAVGAWLDNIGALWEVTRLEGETDEAFRARILASNSRGSGFAASISNAVGQVTGVTHVCVLDNGNEDPTVLPNATNGIAIDPHSVYIVVAGGSNDAIANAIYKTKSLGCAYHLGEGDAIGTLTSVDIMNGEEVVTTVKFYRPNEVEFTIQAEVFDSVYSGSDIEASVKSAIVDFLKDRTINTVVTKGEIMAAIAQNAGGAVCSELTITRAGVSGGGDATYSEVDTITLRPFEYANITADDITVSVV